MQRIATLFITLMVIWAAPQLVHGAEPGTDKAAAIRQIMALGGVDDLAQNYGKTITEQIYQVLKTSRPELPAEAMVVIRGEVDKQLETDREQLLAQIAAIFDRSFTAGEIEELTRFYQTELGKKTLALMPKIMQENMEIGKSWGKKIGPPLKARMEARFKQNPPVAPK